MACEARAFLADTKGETLQKRSKNRVLSEVQNGPNFPRNFVKIKKESRKLAREARRKFLVFLVDTKGGTLQKRSKIGYFRRSKMVQNSQEIL